MILILNYMNSIRIEIDDFVLLLGSDSSRVTLHLLKYGISILYTTLTVYFRCVSRAGAGWVGGPDINYL